MPLHTENELAVLFAKGEEMALAHFYHSYYPALCLFAFQYVNDRDRAEEIAADAFINTWRQHTKLDTTGAIRAYLYTVARHECFRVLKKIQRTTHHFQAAPDQPSPEENGFDKLVSVELARHLQTALQELPPGVGKILTLHFMEGKTLKEIANALHISTSTVKTQKQRGLKALKKRILRSVIFFLCPL